MHIEIFHDLLFFFVLLYAGTADFLSGRSAEIPEPPNRKAYKHSSSPKWELPNIRGTLFWGPYNKDPTI